jgi:hypothetical protein
MANYYGQLLLLINFGAIMSTTTRSKYPFLEQLFWFLLFVGWVPMLASYTYVLDPVAAGRTGVGVMITERIPLYQQYGWGHPAIGILSLIGVISAALLLGLKQWHLLPIPLFLLWSSLIYVFNTSGTDAPWQLAVHVVYGVLAFASTYLFLRHGHLLSGAFTSFVVLLFLDVGIAQGAVLFGASPDTSLFGLVFRGYTPSIINTLLFVTIAVLVRMVWLIIRDNRHFVQSLSRSEMRSALKQTFRLWFIAPLIFVGFGGFWWALSNLWFEPKLTAEIEEQTNLLQNDIISWLIDNEPMAFNTHVDYIEGWIAEHDDVDDLERALYRWSDMRLGFIVERQRKGVQRASRAARRVEDLPDIVETEMTQAFPASSLPLLDEPNWCFFLDPVCKTKRWITSSTNDMMRNTRQSLIDETVDALEAPVDGVNQSVDDMTNAAFTSLGESHNTAQLTATASISGGFRTWRNVSLLAGLYSAIILLKTLLIVFSRVVFAPKGESSIRARFLPDDTPDGAPTLLHHKQVYHIPTSAPDAHFVARRGVTLEGPPPARRRPLGLRLPVARLLGGSWVMNRIDGNRADNPDEFDAELKVDEPAELVSWTLREGERVVFRFSDFVGMSESLNLGRISSLSLTTLVLGRMIFHYAEGPGVLILRTTAAARLGPSPEAERPAPMPKLVAWGSSTRFSIVAALTTMDTFFSGHNLKTSQGDAVVWDTSTRRGDGPGTGILRFMKSFLLPI